MNEQTVIIPIDLIDPNPYQPREAMDPDAVRRLAADIKRDGLMQIPSARQVNGHYQLAFGHRRLEAFKLNGETQMPLIIRDLSDLQMFERGVSENVQRDDLNRIEVARAMRRYMDDFGKNSFEAAEFFGVSPEQVRATIRLLDLPPVAQDQLAAGAINIEGARMILSMQKVASQETIEKTVERLVQGVDRYQNQATPAEIVQQAVRDLDETVMMWTDERDAKPRSSPDYRGDGWLLSMKNFPNKMLPDLMPVDMAIALGIQDDQHLIAAANTWAMFKRGQSDELPQDVLDQIPQDIREKVEHLLNPPACSSCPFYTKIEGVHYCGMKTCHDRKTIAWKAEAIRAAVKDLGIQEYDQRDGSYKVLETYGWDHDLFTQRHKDLRLIARDRVRGYHYQSGSFPGVKDHAFLVVLTGEALKAEKAGNREKNAGTKLILDADQLRLKLIAENRQRLEWMVATEVATLFEGFTDQAIHTLQEAAFDWSTDLDDIPEEFRPQEMVPGIQRGLISLAMIREANTNDDRNLAKLYDYYERLVIITKAWKVRPSKKIGALAMRMDQEIADAVAELKSINKAVKAVSKKKGAKS